MKACVEGVQRDNRVPIVPAAMINNIIRVQHIDANLPLALALAPENVRSGSGGSDSAPLIPIQRAMCSRLV